jgi:hypothetical protein
MTEVDKVGKNLGDITGLAIDSHAYNSLVIDCHQAAIRPQSQTLELLVHASFREIIPLVTSLLNEESL